jgi:hypothetical protein
MLPKIPHVKPGDVITAEDFNAIAERLERCMNLTVAQGSGLVMSSGPWGKALGLALPHDIWGQLSGSSSPYSFVEVMRTTSNTWATFGHRSGTSNAYEINGKSGLNGKVVQLSWTPAGDWRFEDPRLGNPKWTFAVNGCGGAALAGAVVTLKQGGVTIATCTTGDGTGGTTLGQCTVSVPSGSYDVTIAASGYSSYTNTLSISGTTTTTVTLTADASHVCFTAGCCTAIMPKTLILTYDSGTISLTYTTDVFGDGSNIPGWIGYDNFSTGLIRTAGSGTPVYCATFSGCDGVSYTSGTVGVVFILYCSFGQWKLEEHWIPCNCLSDKGTCPTAPDFHGYDVSGAGTSCPGGAACLSFGGGVKLWQGPSQVCGAGDSFTIATGTSVTCSPFSASFTFPNLSPNVQPATSATVSA